MGLDLNRSLYYVSVLAEMIDSMMKKTLKKIDHQQLSPRDLGILLDVARACEGKMNMSEAYSKEMRARSSVSDIAKRLEKLGYISKKPAPDNAKKIVLVSNEKAHTLYNAITPEVSDIVDKLYAGFSEEEKNQHIKLTVKAYENLTGRKVDIATR